MHCKIFHSRRHSQLEAAVNDWLAAHPGSRFPLGPQYTTCLVADDVEYILEHTLILFYSEPDTHDPFATDEDEEEETAASPGYGLGPTDQLLSLAEQRAGLL